MFSRLCKYYLNEPKSHQASAFYITKKYLTILGTSGLEKFSP